MKLLEWIKIFGFSHIEPKHERHHEIAINQEKISGVSVVSHSTNSKTYGLLRKFKTPRYNIFYLVRKAKGFNTIFFQQHYDVVICDKNFKIIDFFIDQKTGFISKHYPNGYFVYFATVGTIKHNNFNLNDQLRIINTLI